MNIFEIIPQEFRHSEEHDNSISCILPFGRLETLIDNYSSIPTYRLIDVLNGRLTSTGITYENVTCERRADDVIVLGTNQDFERLRTLCIVRKITAAQLEISDSNAYNFQSEVVYIMMAIFSNGTMPEEYRTTEDDVEDCTPHMEELDKPTVLDEDALIDTNDLVDKISKCCNDNTTKIIVRYKDNELKIIDTYLEKDFLYIDVINSKKTKG